MLIEKEKPMCKFWVSQVLSLPLKSSRENELGEDIPSGARQGGHRPLQAYNPHNSAVKLDAPCHMEETEAGEASCLPQSLIR